MLKTFKFPAWKLNKEADIDSPLNIELSDVRKEEDVVKSQEIIEEVSGAISVLNCYMHTVSVIFPMAILPRIHEASLTTVV
jgi:type III secretory pathway component EscU